MIDFNETARKVQERLDTTEEEANKIVMKAISGGEINEEITPEKWLSERFLPNCVFIDESGYSRMCVDALKILSKTSATDYGSSRQRDLGQLWADMTRGYLGELALKNWLESKWKVEVNLGHNIGSLKDFLPLDIHEIKKTDGNFRLPKVKVSIKATKLNGIWLDIPGDQFNHSDLHILVKVGTGRDHLFAFFKSISVFKDKVLKKGEEIGSITADESKEMYDNLPSFKPIPAYICGFASKNIKYHDLSYNGKKGRINYNITAWNGPINSDDLLTIKKRETVPGKISFEGIEKFSHNNGYLFNTGNLKWEDKDWEKEIEKM